MSAFDINTLVNTLAEKLGPLAAQVWTAYLNQQTVIAHQELAMAGILGLVLLVVSAMGLWSITRAPEPLSSDEDLHITARVIVVVVGLAILIVGGYLLTDALAHLSNPSYYALQGLLGR